MEKIWLNRVCLLILDTAKTPVLNMAPNSSVKMVKYEC